MSTGTTAGTDVDLLSDEAIANPYGYLAPVRERSPLAWSERHRAWIVTRHDDVSDLMRDDRFTANRVGTYLQAHGDSPEARLAAPFYRVAQEWMTFHEGADHSRLRSLVQSAFSPRVVAALQRFIVELTDELVDDIPVGEPFDLIERIAYPLPAIVIATMLGVPPEDRDAFKSWSEGLSALVFAAGDNPTRHADAAAATEALAAYIEDLIAQRRAEPRDDLISRLIASREADDRLTELEIVANCVLLLFAGHETTTNLVGNSVVALLDRPQQAAGIAAELPASRTAIEELLRFDSPGKTVIRIALRDVELHDVRVRAGERLFLLQSAANRDPRRYDRPDDLDLTRSSAGTHTTFGAGPHYCLGAPLARLEGRLALPLLMRRLGGLRPAGELRWLPNVLTRGLRALPVVVDEVLPRAPVT